MRFDSVIIGAGISGLVVAHRLKKMGRDPLVIESGDRVGGVIQSRDAEGFLIECGPNSLRGSHELLDLVDELNLTGELIAADPRAPAYVYADGRLQAAPMSPPALVKTKLISNAAKLRLLREPFVEARRGGGEESIASFVRRRLGDEVLERMVAPFLSGVYAGDPEELSVQACFPKLAEFEAEAGGILRGALRALRQSRKEARKEARRGTSRPKRSLRPYRLCSFRHGLSVLPEALSGSLGDRLLTGARIIDIKSGGGFEIKVEHRGEIKTINSPALVLSTPAYVTATLIGAAAPELAALVAEIPYVSIASVPLAYRAGQVACKLDGFGFLAPRGEGLRTLGSVWNSSLFAGRAPAGWVCLTNFIGGATDPEAVKLGDEELIRIVHNDLSKVLGVIGEPRRLPITRHARAIPQYTLGHAARVERIESLLRGVPGLWIAGNYLRGVSLGDCIKHAGHVAVEIGAAA
ncbi:MAG TPA: protoporphyrinogen oxidase [Blastocatellia bacterium]|jgi:oxygen-dependent protoporphyrinogen oxidase|nr:protoporphyrinogen oxidase [Blastocatellia bacterium]